MQCSRKLNIMYREGFNKNRYVGRTFIMPGQQVRRKNVRRKLNAMALEFHGKNVLLVDGKKNEGRKKRRFRTEDVILFRFHC